MINVISGDIAQVEADALVTAINSGGAWFGGIDGVIQRAAGGYFHKQAADKFPLKDGMVVVANGNDAPNKGKFKNVVFVVDDLIQPLSELVIKALKAADEAGYQTISLPTIRMGVMAGVMESVQEAAQILALIVKEFMLQANNVKTINIVVYNNPLIEQLLKEAISGKSIGNGNGKG